jgi:hypothetical protein
VTQALRVAPSIVLTVTTREYHYFCISLEKIQVWSIVRL